MIDGSSDKIAKWSCSGSNLKLDVVINSAECPPDRGTSPTRRQVWRDRDGEYDREVHDADQGIEPLLTAVQQSVQAGRWYVAKETSGAVVERADVGEALFGIGVACWWLGDVRRMPNR